MSSDDREPTEVAVRSEIRGWTTLYPAVLAAVTTLLGAAIGGGVAAYVAHLGVDSQLTAQQIQFREEREQKERELRSAAYIKLLHAAQAYSERQQSWSACSNVESADLGLYPQCATFGKDSWQSWLNLRAAADEVLLYGSDEAISLVGALTVDGLFKRREDLAAEVVKLRSEASRLDRLARDEAAGLGQSGRIGVGPAAVRLRRDADAFRVNVLLPAEQELAEINESLRGHSQPIDPAASPEMISRLRCLICREINPSPRANCEKV